MENLNYYYHLGLHGKYVTHFVIQYKPECVEEGWDIYGKCNAFKMGNHHLKEAIGVWKIKYKTDNQKIT